jgi:hypothetical protein
VDRRRVCDRPKDLIPDRARSPGWIQPGFGDPRREGAHAATFAALFHGEDQHGEAGGEIDCDEWRH